MNWTLTTQIVLLLAIIPASVSYHEIAHCTGTGRAPWQCDYTVHYHGTSPLGLDHVIHSSHYTPGDHSWIIPTQLALTALFAGLIVAWVAVTPNRP